MARANRRVAKIPVAARRGQHAAYPERLHDRRRGQRCDTQFARGGDVVLLQHLSRDHTAARRERFLGQPRRACLYEYYCTIFSMTSRTPYARIAITLPEADLAAADRLAKQQDRSRSWIVAEAVRQYAASIERDESTMHLGRSRLTQLQRDLTLTPEQRVQEAEHTSALSEQITAPRRFATFDEFLAWQRAGGAAT